MGEQGNSPASIEDSGHAYGSSASSTEDLRTELKLGLSLSISSRTSSSSSREQLSDWPPTKLLVRSTLDEKRIPHHPASFFVKVHMEGIPVGRKLDLFALDGYDSLIRTLRCMFSTNISCKHRQNIFPTTESQTLMPLRYEYGPELAFPTTPFTTGPGLAQVSPTKTYLVIYEDMEGDWMMVGDVPWELFLNTVKRLKIAKADKC